MAGVFEDSLQLQHYLRGTNPNSGLQRIPVMMQQRQQQALQLAAERRKLQDAIALQQVRDTGDLQQAKAQSDAYLHRAEAMELGRLKRELMIRTKVYPHPGESDQDFIARAGEETGKREEEESKRAANVLEGFDKQTLEIENEINTVLQAEQARQEKVAEAYAMKQLGGSIDIEPKEKAVIQAAIAKGFSLEDAIKQLKKPDRQAAVRQALDGYRLDGQTYAQQTMPKTVAQKVRSLEERQKGVGSRANQFLTTPQGQKGNSFRFLNTDAPREGSEKRQSTGALQDAAAPAGGMQDFVKALAAAGVQTKPVTSNQSKPVISGGNDGAGLESIGRAILPWMSPGADPGQGLNYSGAAMPRHTVEPDPVARPLSLQPMTAPDPQQRAMQLRGALRNILDRNFKSLVPFEGPERAMQLGVEAMSQSPEAQELSHILSMSQQMGQPKTNRVTTLQPPAQPQYDIPPALMRLP